MFDFHKCTYYVRISGGGGTGTATWSNTRKENLTKVRCIEWPTVSGLFWWTANWKLSDPRKSSVLEVQQLYSLRYSRRLIDWLVTRFTGHATFRRDDRQGGKWCGGLWDGGWKQCRGLWDSGGWQHGGQWNGNDSERYQLLGSIPISEAVKPWSIETLKTLKPQIAFVCFSKCLHIVMCCSFF